MSKQSIPGHFSPPTQPGNEAMARVGFITPNLIGTHKSIMGRFSESKETEIRNAINTSTSKLQYS